MWGFVLSIILTAIPFWLVMGNVLAIADEDVVQVVAIAGASLAGGMAVLRRGKKTHAGLILR